MKKSSSLIFGIILSIFLQQTGFAQTLSRVLPTPKKESAAPVREIPVTVEKIESDMSEALTIIQDSHVDGKKLDYNELFKSSIDSMLHTLDPHSGYYDAKESDQFRTDQQSQYFGIGASIGDLRDSSGKNTTTFIKATFENAPAWRAGLRYGDKILEVNGVSMLDKPYSEVRSNLRGPRGTVAKIVVEKYGTGKRETIEIVRDAVPQPSIPEAYLIRPGVGYIAMTGGFNQTTFDEFRTAMRRLKSQGMTQLVLDLRGNPGGLVVQSFQVANTFLSRGQSVFTQKGRMDGVADTYQADNPNPEKMPLVVMINGGSASASEILAGALQDHDRALLVGENTFGKALVMNPYGLDYGSMLMLVIAKYTTPSGRLIQRDYSNGNLYDYYSNSDSATVPKGAESKTDGGRSVYGGNGIAPDDFIKPSTIPIERAKQQQKLLDPIFAFSLDLSFGKIAGFESYKVDRAITFNYDLKANDFVISEPLFQEFKKYAAGRNKISSMLMDKEKDFVIRMIRSELVMAAYGTTTQSQVIRDIDNQLTRAIELLPKAKQLAAGTSKTKSSVGSLN